MNLNERRSLGLRGEKLVVSWFNSLGNNVEFSEDKFDDKKDLIVDGKSVEVKTQTIYRKFPIYDGTHTEAFTVPILADSKVYRNQLNKCLTVDRLIFVSRPTEYLRSVNIYEAQILGKREFTIIQNKLDNRYVAGFIVDNMSLLVSIEKETIIKDFI